MACLLLQLFPRSFPTVSRRFQSFPAVTGEAGNGGKRLETAGKGGETAGNCGETAAKASTPHCAVLGAAGFGPTFGGPVSMGYVESVYGEVGAPLMLMIRGKERPAHVAALPFVAHRYARAAPHTTN